MRHRGALLQELGVGDDAEGMVGAARGQRLRHGLAHLLGRAHRHRALGDDEPAAVHVAADVARRREHVPHVGRAVVAGGRAHGDELHLAVGGGECGVGGEGQAPRGHVAAHHLLQPGLVQRHLASLQARDLVAVQVQAQHFVAHVGQAGAADQPHVAGSDHRQLHRASLPFLKSSPALGGRWRAIALS
jgi:hypothetical protein